ncbi:5-oxoprolinase subunit PxpA [Pontimicrobium aquaticum]|uniref:5-oxoprolinase subunit PxpA n=1 Tax=Pontimicrobium aquaticum TaxID=2565367 RepID=A0A4U0EQF3_9FLAO|nr:5-oxoprolinase subunit PxpA [Pontimicrobium aquaticum]TJY33916.1 5-oxoprolinase subunit PxpA [Pontimicrobium aquaticum]
MTNISIDINADIGEGVGNEANLIPLLSSCNIACGGHAGNLETMNWCVALAKENRVKIGAHPSFPDKENFGRQIVKMSCSALYQTIKNQIKTLMSVVRDNHAALHHVKPHGALYNLAATDKKTAEVVVEVMKSIHLPLKLYVPFGSVISGIAIKEKIPITYEVFADRNYNDDLSLVSRSKENAIIKDEDVMTSHIQNMILHKKVKTINSVEVFIEAETICVHGDNPEALKLIKKLRQNLIDFGIKIQ